MGSLITNILVTIWKVPHFKSESSAKNYRGTYNLTSWKKSLSQASIYVRSARDKHDSFICMKNTSELGAKNKVIQGSTRQCAHSYHPTRQPEEKGIKGTLKRILKKIDFIGRNQVKMAHNQVQLGCHIHFIGDYLELPEFQQPFDEDMGPQEVPGRQLV